MDNQRIDEIARKLMAGRRAHIEREIGSVYYHGVRAAKAVLNLRRAVLPGDDSRDAALEIAARFHDIGKGIEPHARYGAVLAREALKDELPAPLLKEVARLISLHCDRRPGCADIDDYAKLLQDADLLDHFGVYEIWMSFNFQAYEGAGLDAALEYYEAELENFLAKHERLVNFPYSQRVFAEKADFERRFVARMRVEAAGDYVLPEA